jgi:class 3 adenylate cyclase
VLARRRSGRSELKNCRLTAKSPAKPIWSNHGEVRGIISSDLDREERGIIHGAGYHPGAQARGLSLVREQRKLAAIVAVDVAGYSRLMSRDESGTLALLREHRRERLEPIFANYGGRLVKLTGDGALMEFPSAVGAVSAAIAFQQAMTEANKVAPEDSAIVFRIGVHLGDVIVEDNDLYGDGVNIAARLEAEAPSGGIVISGNVHDAVTAKLKANFGDLGEPPLKNIDRPVRAYRVEWAAADCPGRARCWSCAPCSSRPRLPPWR